MVSLVSVLIKKTEKGGSMFTKKQLSFLDGGNFQLIRITDDYIEFRSRNTRHCWIIKKEKINVKCPYTIYHKHKLTDYYHRHWQSYSFEKCLESIKNHDDYVRRVDPMLTALKQGKSRDVKYY